MALAGAPEAPKPAIVDGDRVVLLGNTFVERDQEYGYLETILTSRFKGLIVRNLGWSGDTVWGEARAGFGTAEDGFKQLKEHVEALKPTVILVGYGANEAFAGEMGLPRFREGLNRLLDVLAKTGARIVLIGPMPLENLGPPLPSPVNHNADLKLYGEALRQAAAERIARYVDLMAAVDAAHDGKRGETSSAVFRVTDDGVHLTDGGYREVDRILATALGISPQIWRVEVRDNGAVVKGTGCTVRDVGPLADGRPGVHFRATADELPGTSLCHALDIEGLRPGHYELRVDGRTFQTIDSEEKVGPKGKGWDVGLFIDRGPDFDRAAQLRAAVNEKNRLYFYRWRPQNETYLFGFRKHEQGQNAREIPLFDPLVEAKEREIARLRVPVEHTYELVRVKEAGK